ncbi:hypothetical protein [Streptomyces sp. NPDC088348]|uniref:hypothetical protein n=1 Tax=Streptomyces sp. NPDC088348 TaxID=3365853 RepID=UPI003803AAA0
MDAPAQVRRRVQRRRLALGALTGIWFQHSYSYSDGDRWTLESRLGHLLQDLERLAAEADRWEQEKELREAEQRRRWNAVVARAHEQKIERHRATVLTGQIRAWRQADEIRAFCQAARARAGKAPVAADEADWLEWAESYAVQLDPLHEPLRTSVDPPAGREVLRELAKIDADAYPWPLDSDGRWTLPDDRPTDPRT